MNADSVTFSFSLQMPPLFPASLPASHPPCGVDGNGESCVLVLSGLPLRGPARFIRARYRVEDVPVC